MPTAITPLANITLSSSASTVTFSSISGSYRDLIIVANVQGGGEFGMRFNSVSTNTYTNIGMLGNGTSALSSTYSPIGYLPYAYSYGNSGKLCNHIIQIFDYSATNKHKAVLSRFEESATNSSVNATAGRWASTSAITTVAFGFGGTFAAGSTFALYGVSA